MNKMCILLILTMMIAISTSKEWYQKGRPHFLTHKNFDKAIQEPNKYKFVKFFTHSCKFCRMLKDVEDKLMAEQQWSFRLYDVDCSDNYDLCVQTVQPSSYPYVGIFNLKGQLQAQLKGYYPINVMRQVFQNLTLRQNHALKKAGVIQQNVVKNAVKAIESEKPIEVVEKQIEVVEQPKDNEVIKKDEPSSPNEVQTKDVSSTSQNGSKNEGGSSVREGIKILMVVFGYWLFNKMVRPYFDLPVPEYTSKSKQIEIPLSNSGEYVKKSDSESNQETNFLLNEEI